MDKVVMLSPILLDIFRNYFQTQQPQLIKYLFERQVIGTPYTTRSAQRVFQLAKEKAGFKKDVGFHSLLGHFDIRTTERYIHVKKESLINIVSPFDNLWKNEYI